ncbi:30S ribosomal protein S4 [Candidatus Woesearchaeota archaeon]|nr:30S ribosomal protein S4 [Candidatus Woesearchaeota archaeon]
MGDIKKLKKKYSGPSHPWQKARIVDEKDLLREYGLKNKKDIWKATSKLRNYRQQVKKLLADTSEHAMKQKESLLSKLKKFNFMANDGNIDDVLNIEVNSILDRRLQTLVCKKGFARTMNQARQLIVHRHIMVGASKITHPSYLVSLEEEAQISYSPYSSFHDPDHPERVPPETVAPETTEEKPKKKATEKKPKAVKIAREDELEAPIENLDDTIDEDMSEDDESDDISNDKSDIKSDDKSEKVPDEPKKKSDKSEDVLDDLKQETDKSETVPDKSEEKSAKESKEEK